MKFTLPEGVFPSVRLSRRRQAALVQEAKTVVSETIAADEAFLAQGATFRSPKWRLVRVKEGLHVYRQRSPSSDKQEKSSPETQSSTWPTPRSSKKVGPRKRLGTDFEDETPSPSSEDSIQELMRRPSVSLMVLHGTVDGTLDDSMFGAFAATDHAWKWRSSHVNDRLDDARILATVQTPSRTDPFRFLGIKWFAKEHPAVLTGILQRRDFLIMEATGLTTDSKGEKVGYFLMHSVALRAVPELSGMGILRGELSFCFILRQSGPGKVELYCRGFSDPRGEMMERVSVAIAAEALICAAGVVDYAYIKKLTWLMKRKGEQLATQSGRENRPSRCESCHKSFTTFALLAVATGTATVGSGSACQICRRVVCAKCSVVKKMTVDVSDTGVVKQCSLRFCLACLLEAKEKSAWEMAMDGLEASLQSPPTSGSSSGTPHTRFASLPHKANCRRDGRSYSEYQRAGTRVYRQGEMATNFSRTNQPNTDQRHTVNHHSRSGNSRSSGRSQTAPEERAALALSGAEERYMYRVLSPRGSSKGPERARQSERLKSLCDMRVRTMN
ncbi:hypothetical protein KRP22_006433 [Phytophthora ramorum]|uniref:uncharacterized protein n=1 Tax=Phytophthora ramorum TaxID=164328 RepID=UPI00309CBF99|nr:hypothetical protein KRP23_4334 [Phytophthora ramorum]KAH7507334.1 hypothetical protein KRP22_2436 [Phytophthora ramorum]